MSGVETSAKGITARISDLETTLGQCHDMLVRLLEIVSRNDAGDTSDYGDADGDNDNEGGDDLPKTPPLAPSKGAAVVAPETTRELADMLSQISAGRSRVSSVHMKGYTPLHAHKTPGKASQAGSKIRSPIQQQCGLLLSPREDLPMTQHAAE